MEPIWRIEQIVVLVFGSLVLAYVTYFLGSAVGEIIEWIIRGIPGFLYFLPQNLLGSVFWIGRSLWSILVDPIHAISVIFGMVLVVVYFLGTRGFFDAMPQVHRGSRIRDAGDIRNRFEVDDDLSPARQRWLPRFWRGSQLASRDELEQGFDSKSSIWSSIIWTLKKLFQQP